MYSLMLVLLIIAYSSNHPFNRKSSSLLVDARWIGAHDLKPKDNATFVLVEKLNSLPSFYVGSVHYDWVLNKERNNLDIAEKILGSADKRNKCNCVDVGMNDGFYTQMFASYGCKVWSFELQPRCIEVSREALTMNGLYDRVNIINSPVSDRNGGVVRIPFGADSINVCDGGFSFSGSSPEKRAHIEYDILGYHKFHSLSLDSFFPTNFKIDYLKIDVEGHEPEVSSLIFVSHTTVARYNSNCFT